MNGGGEVACRGRFLLGKGRGELPLQDWTRRSLLAGLLAGAAGPVLAEAPLRSPRPPPRPRLTPVAAPGLVRGAEVAGGFAGPTPEALVTAAALGGVTGLALLDAGTGALVEGFAPAAGLPPASTVKALTALYALETLGPRHRFATRVLATAPASGGILQGDLVLAGGGDPTLTTDVLADLAATIRAQGITGVAGRFLVWGGALPGLREIDGGQPAHVGYNPSVSGLNLNFNRVHFGWKKSGAGYDLVLDARDRRHAPPVGMARVTLADRDSPVFVHSLRDRGEEWSVARPALGAEGGRWLPVRLPELYAADVFRTLAAAQGLALPAPEPVAALPAGAVLAATESAPLADVLEAMLKHSTNLTAEAVGMAASAARGGLDRHAQSGRAMADWLAARAAVQGARFVDHSGLGGASRIAPADLAAALLRLGPGSGLPDLLKPVKLKDAKGRPMASGPQVAAKTGTLNFVSALAGFLTASDGRRYVFAITSADVARRDALALEQRERPPGGRAWLGRARALQNALLLRWGGVRA